MRILEELGGYPKFVLDMHCAEYVCQVWRSGDEGHDVT